MCGVIGYVGRRTAKPLLLQGLERLEYRGYDSAGICLHEARGLDFVRTVGNLDRLKAVAGLNGSRSTTGIGHTRWATHGRVCEANAHPLTGSDDRVAIALNGIIENFGELKERLAAGGHEFSSDTDAEVVAHLVEHHYGGDLVEAVSEAYLELEGHFAFVVIHEDHPDLLVGARLRCPMVVGIGDGETFVASSIAALLRETRQVKALEDGEVVAISPAGARFFFMQDELPERKPLKVDWDDEGADKRGFETFMLKEIHEQPATLARTLEAHLGEEGLVLPELGLRPDELATLTRICVVACGTAYHAGLVGRYLFENWARLRCEVDIASEWRYRDPVVEEDTLVIAVSQSGETADTIAATRLAAERGARTLAVTNTPGSQLTRDVDSVLYTRTGVEMGVAATKTFTAQAVLMVLLALHFAEARGTLGPDERRELVAELRALPGKALAYLEGYTPLDEIAERHHHKSFFLYLGRGVGLPICLEGALKLKEISYIPTEAYAAGEMKHGPIALLDEETPVVCVATDSPVYPKLMSNIQEVRARGAQVIAIASHGNDDIQHHASDVVFVPRTHPLLQPLLAVLPLQLLAYRIARLRGLNVDQPRNLAKTVTVE